MLVKMLYLKEYILLCLCFAHNKCNVENSDIYEEINKHVTVSKYNDNVNMTKVIFSEYETLSIHFNILMSSSNLKYCDNI